MKERLEENTSEQLRLNTAVNTMTSEKLRELGIRPLLHGVVLWIVLSTVWCLAIYFKLVNAA